MATAALSPLVALSCFVASPSSSFLSLFSSASTVASVAAASASAAALAAAAAASASAASSCLCWMTAGEFQSRAHQCAADPVRTSASPICL